MNKNELINLHQLVYLASEEIVSSEFPDKDFEDLFPVYTELDLSPTDWKEGSKRDHEDSLKVLTGSMADRLENDEQGFYERLLNRLELEDSETVRIMGELFSEQGYSRPESADLISEEVDFTYSTVYDMFTKNNITFTFHSEDKRTQAVEKLKEYAEGSTQRSEALSEVSEDFDVPEGTLKNWLTDAEIRFTKDVSALLEPDSQRELIQTVEHYFDFREGREHLEQVIGRGRDTIWKYRNGEIKTMPLEVLERIESVIDSEPRYRMDDPERYLQEDSGKTVVVEDDFQKYLFSHLSGEEFNGITGKSPSTQTRYVSNKSNRIDADAYRKTFQVVSYLYDKRPVPQVEMLVDRNVYKESSENPEDAEIGLEEVENSDSLYFIRSSS